MYFNNKNNFFHGIMFHHFHDGKLHRKSQGSITSDDLYKLINFIGKKNILDANIFFEKFKKKKLKENHVCFTFDDAIKSQIDIALPVLEDFKIKSFFFVYTSLFEGNPDNLEVYRYFRTNYFENINNFYSEFYKALGKNLDKFFYDNENFIKNRKKILSYYSIEDIKFRLVRDKLLSKESYEKVMNFMMKEKKFKVREYNQRLFFDKKNLIQLNSLGHLIGLHSHTHPTLMENLSYDQQKFEYKKSISIISKILKKSENDIKFMSHPCGSYNKDTLNILKELGIELGFKQIMEIEPNKEMKKINNSHLEIARQDHAEIFMRINK